MTESNVGRPAFGDALEDHRQEDEEEDDRFDGDGEPERRPIVLADRRRQARSARPHGVVDGSRLKHPRVRFETVREGGLQHEARRNGEAAHHDEDDAQHPRTLARPDQVTVHDAFEVAEEIYFFGQLIFFCVLLLL